MQERLPTVIPNPYMTAYHAKMLLLQLDQAGLKKCLQKDSFSEKKK